MVIRPYLLSLLLIVLLLPPFAAVGSEPAIAAEKDPHYTAAGFFDLYVCNWPNRPPFFMILFSTPRYSEVESIAVFRPDGQPLTHLDLTQYRLIQRPGKPEKRAFITQLTLPPDAADGWYSARIMLKNGEHYFAKDYVIIYAMAQVSRMLPADSANEIAIPTELTWAAVPGARFYQAYIKDAWNDGKLIYTSQLLDVPRLVLPVNLIQPGGLYTWRVQARDVDENVLLGDFNHGSLSREIQFSVAP